MLGSRKSPPFSCFSGPRFCLTYTVPAACATTQWFHMWKTRQNISLPKLISRVFPWTFLQITSVSGCLRFTFKICQTVAGTSMIRWFHEFFESRFWRVFAILPNCAVLSLYYCSFPPHSLIMHRLFFDALRAPPVKRAAAANARVNVERCVLTSF